ncbi:MAG: response regulator [Candidatus Onthomonas sp.]
MRILVAEGEARLNELIVKRLKLEHYSVDTCQNGLDALDYLACAEYDAVILDIMLPGADGFQVLRTLREQQDRTPVLFLTARDGIDDRVAGLDAGADDI